MMKNLKNINEPKIHCIKDELGKDHPLAFNTIYCEACGEMIHSCTNELMTSWVETGKGNYCLDCFNFLINHFNDNEQEYGLIE